MTQRFKRKTLAVSIAAALFGGMALAVAPIMTPVAMANQFEAADFGMHIPRNMYTGVPASDVAGVETGVVQIQAAGQVPWHQADDNEVGLSYGGLFTVTLPAGIQLWRAGVGGADPVFFTPTTSTVPADVEDAFDIRNITSTAGIWGSEIVATDFDSSGRLVVTFEIYKTAISSSGTSDSPTSFEFWMKARMPAPGDLKVDFADAVNEFRVPLSNALGLGSNPNLKGVTIATFSNDSATLTTTTPVTSVDPGLTRQQIADFKVELFTSAVANSRLIFTLDNGTWYAPPTTNSQIPVEINPSNNKELIYTIPIPSKPAWDTFSGALVNLSQVDEDTDINVTVTSVANGAAPPIPGFGTHTVKVARTKGTSGKDVTVGLTTDPTTDVLYVGRNSQTVTNAVKLAEAMPATLTPNGTLNYTLSTGVFNPTSTLVATGTADGPVCEPIGTTASAKFECYAQVPTSTATAGSWTLPPLQGGGYAGPFNMYNATVGDLNVTIDGTAWTNWTSNVVKLADVKKATTSTLDGSVDTLRLSSSGTTKMTLPDIVIQENNAGALVAGPFVVAIDEGLNLNVLPTTEVKVFNKDGAEVNVQLGQIRSPSWMIGGGAADGDRGIDIEWTSLPAANGPYKIVISGVQVEADSSTSPGDYNLSVASTLLDGDIRPIDYRSDTNGTLAGPVAGVYFESFPAVKVIDNLTTTAWVDASGPIDNLSAYANILPGIEARGKSGSYYLMLQMPPQFTGDWSLWTLGPSGWTMVTPATTDPELCSTMTSYQGGTLDDVTNMPLVVDTDMTVFKDVMVWTGYGVGATLFHPEAPCLNMLENSTYWYVYTVK